MSNVSKRRREGTRSKIKSMGDHKEFLKRITKTLYYGQLPTLPCLSMPVTEISCELWSMAQRGRSLRRLHTDEAASIARSACVSPCALVLAILYLERLKTCNPDFLHNTEPSDLFLVSLMVSNKFLQDDGEDDEVVCSEWAASANLDVKRLKRLEVHFLNAIDWKIFVSSEAFELGLRRLERAVALRQARLQGFFTYTDLLAASAGHAPLAAASAAAAAAAACLALALAYLASLAALLAAAPLASRAAHQLAAATAAAPVPPGVQLPHCLNATVELPELPTEPEASAAAWAERGCCSQWPRRLEGAGPRRSWRDSVWLGDWAYEPWWSTTPGLAWLYQSSLVDPMQRWLDRLGDLRELFDAESVPARRPAEPCPAAPGGGGGGEGRCVRQWLNLSKLSALMVTVSDR